MTDARFPKVPKGVSRWPNGEPMLVLRPDQSSVPTRIALAQVAARHQNEEALEAATEGPMKFLGFLVKDKATDENGENAQALEAGDVFVEPSSLQEAD